MVDYNMVRSPVQFIHQGTRFGVTMDHVGYCVYHYKCIPLILLSPRNLTNAELVLFGDRVRFFKGRACYRCQRHLMEYNEVGSDH